MAWHKPKGSEIQGRVKASKSLALVSQVLVKATQGLAQASQGLV